MILCLQLKEYIDDTEDLINIKLVKTDKTKFCFILFLFHPKILCVSLNLSMFFLRGMYRIS